jgi:energy-converting hydrogenase A subunit P
MKTCKVGDAIVEEDNKVLIDQKKCISCGECLKTCPVKGAIKGIHISHIEEQKEIINLVVDTLEAKIETEQDEIKKISGGEVYKLDMPADELIEKAREILSNDELIDDIIENITDRLKLRVITWDKEKCTNCRLCVKECPSHAINYTPEEGVVRDTNKCLKCSICYQTCPFGAIGYYIARFLYKSSPEDENIIHITLKTSDLPVRS